MDERSPERPQFIKQRGPDGTEEVLINRAGVELLLQQKVDELAAGGMPFDEIAEWVAQRRCWLGLDRPANG